MSSIRVVCRFRPQNKLELAQGGDSIVSIAPENDSVTINGSESNHSFSFDYVFPSNTTQRDVYDHAAKPVIEDIMAGYNGTLFVYGQTGSGKTFSMTGINDPNGDQELRGIVPRMIETVFEFIKNADENIEFGVKASYIEIYMERIRDLLDPRKDNLKVREEEGKGVWVEGTSEVFFYREEDILDVINTGISNRAIAETRMNAESSRSHSIFILTIQQKNLKVGSIKTGKLYLVDLAGSEKISKTGAQGTTLDEAKMINKSLSSLGNVINALTDGKSTHIPYRDSKLTRVLQESLGGNSRTTLIINCSPSSYNEAETISTLRFGSRAKNIKNKAKINQERSAAELKILLSKAENEIENLKGYIKELETVSGVTVSNLKSSGSGSGSGSGSSSSSSGSSGGSGSGGSSNLSNSVNSTSNLNTSSNTSSSNVNANANVITTSVSAPTSPKDTELIKVLQEKCIQLEKQLFKKEEEKKEILEQLEQQQEQIQDKDQEIEGLNSMIESSNNINSLYQNSTNENSVLNVQLSELKLALEKSRFEATEQSLTIEGLNEENQSIKSQLEILKDRIAQSGDSSIASLVPSTPKSSAEMDPLATASKHADEWNEKAEQLKLLQRTPSKAVGSSKSNTATSSPIISLNISESDNIGSGATTTTNNNNATITPATSSNNNVEQQQQQVEELLPSVNEQLLESENQKLQKRIQEIELEFETYKIAKENLTMQKDLEIEQLLESQRISSSFVVDPRNLDDELPAEMMLQAEQIRKLIAENSEQKVHFEATKNENSKLKNRIEMIEEETRQRMEEELNVLREQTNQKLSEFGSLKESLIRDLENRCQKVIDLELVLDELQDRIVTLNERLKRVNKPGGGDQEAAFVQSKLDEITAVKHQLVIENNKHKTEVERLKKLLSHRGEHILILEKTMAINQESLFKLALNHNALTIEHDRAKNELEKLNNLLSQVGVDAQNTGGARVARVIRGGGGNNQLKKFNHSSSSSTSSSSALNHSSINNNHTTPTPLSANLYSNTKRSTKELNTGVKAEPLSLSGSPFNTSIPSSPNHTSSNNINNNSNNNNNNNNNNNIGNSGNIGGVGNNNSSISNSNNNSSSNLNANLNGNTPVKITSENSSSSLWNIFKKKSPSSTPPSSTNNLSPQSPQTPSHLSADGSGNISPNLSPPIPVNFSYTPAVVTSSTINKDQQKD
nr:kinesin family member 3 [Dictyostelium discoideum]